MSDFRPNQTQSWPQISNNKLIENDPMIVKVPMDEVEWGARKKMMNKARGSDGISENKMSIQHVEGKKV